jgi:anti-sigma-K factor RskA
MSSSKRSDRGGMGAERWDELLLERALFGLSEAGERELGEVDDSREALEYELGAAAVAVAVCSERVQPMSEMLRAKLEAGAKAYFAATSASARPSGAVTDAGASSAASSGASSTSQLGAAAKPKSALRPLERGREHERDEASLREGSSTNSSAAYAGWFAAAAAAVLALIAWWPNSESTTSQTEQRTLLLARADAQTVAAAGQAPFAPDASGDVVWSNAAQSGFIRLVGAPVNDPKVQQYQLWIFDEAQEHPVDGGVFDVTASGEVLIPIDAKLRVAKPTLFAITLEKPGGVVVSDRQRIAIVAAL